MEFQFEQQFNRIAKRQNEERKKNNQHEIDECESTIAVSRQ